MPDVQVALDLLKKYTIWGDIILAAAILAGLAFVNGQKSDKVGALFPVESQIEVKGKAHPYVGRAQRKPHN